MAKADFCYTHYDGDEARDMAHLNRLERGAYTDIRVAQRKFGRLSIERIKKFLSKDFDEVWDSLEAVLTKDENELYYIEWLENSLNQRTKNSAINSLNGALGGRPPKEYYIYKKRIEETLSEIDIQEEIDHVTILKQQADAFEDSINSRIYGFCLKYLLDLQKKESQIKAKQKQSKSETKAFINEDEDGDVNEDELIHKETEQDFIPAGIAPEMVKMFKESFPAYPADREDFSACIEIGRKIAAFKGWNVSDIIDKKRKETLSYWKQVVSYAASDKWYSTRSIADLNKEWKRLMQCITKDGKPAEVKEMSGGTSVSELIKKARAS